MAAGFLRTTESGSSSFFGVGVNLKWWLRSKIRRKIPADRWDALPTLDRDAELQARDGVQYAPEPLEERTLHHDATSWLCLRSLNARPIRVTPKTMA